jgi:cyclopropane fatty-acyl-phospholipid synthase-like methyltransferase
MKILTNAYRKFDGTTYDVAVSIDVLRFIGRRRADGKYIQGKFYMQVNPSSFIDSKVLFQTTDEDAQEV